jgi:hypothetical protein
MKTYNSNPSDFGRIGSEEKSSQRMSPIAFTYRLLWLVTLACSCMSAPAFAQSYSFRVVDVPGSSSSRVLVNTNAGVLVGDYGTTNLSVNSGYVLANGIFNRVAFPGASITFAEGINSHLQVVGYYIEPSGNQHGFMLISGTYRTVDVPGAVSTAAGSLNDVGTLVGWYDDGTRYHGFSGHCSPGGSCGQFTTSDFPGSAGSFINGINNAGQIVGDYSLSDGHLNHDRHGYLENRNSFTALDFPGALDTDAVGLNNAGEIVGDYFDGQASHGYTYITQAYTTFDVPGALNTYVSWINDAGQIVGEHTAQGFDQDYGFLATPISGQRDLSAASPHRGGKQ